MTRIQSALFKRRQARNTNWLNLPIGMRLSLAFLVIILLTGLIGVLAIQQFSSLTHTATEINAHDLPEATVLVHLRSLLYQQRDLEHSLINDGSPGSDQPLASAQPGISPIESDQQPFDTVTPLDVPGASPTDVSNGQSQQARLQTLPELALVLKDIDGDCQQLLAFERPEQKDFILVQGIASNLHKTKALSERIQTLTKHAQIAQARAIDLQQQEPLLLSTIATLARFGTAEQVETANDAVQTQQESENATLFVFALTALSLLLSIVLAITITRSLTRPLKALLYTTEAIAAGDLDVEAPVERTDEIGRLASAYDKMRLSLRSTIMSLSLERQHTQAIIDATADGVILVDGVHKVLRCNPAAERLSGWQANDAIGKYCWEVLGFTETTVKKAETQELLLLLLAALQNRSEQSHIEMPITARTGQQRWLAISCAPMPLDEQDREHYTVIGLHDISQLKAVDQVKSDFVAMVSHELRAPLTTVTGSVEMLSLLEPTADPESYREVLGILDQQTWRLRQVVEEVLQLTRFEAGRLEVQLQPLSVTRFLHNVVEKINAEWIGDDHCIILHEVTEELQVWADDGLLEIVLRNLFENARKYTPQGTAVEVEVEGIMASGQVQIRVVDHGPGIPEEQFGYIFERFSRGSHPAATWTRGYGLGLYIARELMLAHNGSIQAENRETGACFVLSLWMVLDNLPAIMTEAKPGAVEE
jgi:PAS domain S-box-containing protein